MEKTGYFSEQQEVDYTAEDIRFTVKDSTLYATCLGWPGDKLCIKSLGQLYESEISSVTMLGDGHELPWKWSPEGLEVTMPERRPCEHAYVIKISRKPPF